MPLTTVSIHRSLASMSGRHGSRLAKGTADHHRARPRETAASTAYIVPMDRLEGCLYDTSRHQISRTSQVASGLSDCHYAYWPSPPSAANSQLPPKVSMSNKSHMRQQHHLHQHTLSTPTLGHPRGDTARLLTILLGFNTSGCKQYQTKQEQARYIRKISGKLTHNSRAATAVEQISDATRQLPPTPMPSHKPVLLERRGRLQWCNCDPSASYLAIDSAEVHPPSHWDNVAAHTGVCKIFVFESCICNAKTTGPNNNIAACLFLRQALLSDHRLSWSCRRRTKAWCHRPCCTSR